MIIFSLMLLNCGRSFVIIVLSIELVGIGMEVVDVVVFCNRIYLVVFLIVFLMLLFVCLVVLLIFLVVLCVFLCGW